MKITQVNSFQLSPYVLPQKQIHIRSSKYTVRFAENSYEVEKAQRLRFQVFNLELGEGLADSYSTFLDKDEFDEYCHHLLVIENQTNKVIGTYRLQNSKMAEHGRGFYTSSEFSIHLFPSNVLLNALELGRACIHKEHRNGRVLFLLWKGIARYLELNGSRFLFGCCSLTSQDAEEGWKVFKYLQRNHYLHPQYHILVESKFRCPEPHGLPENEGEVKLPHLFMLYLQIGAKVCSPPAIDRAFKTIDFLILLDLKNLNSDTKRLFFE